MGAADVVPGVSGGTIAFITGIYEEFLASIGAINIKLLQILRKDGLKAAWKTVNGNFLLAIFAGIAISVLSLAKAFSWLLKEHPVLVWAFFFGLVGASIWMVLKQVKVRSMINPLFFVLGAGIAYLITELPLTDGPKEEWFVFVSGAIAICAMILPGISGSFILLLLGMYEYVLDAVNNKDILILGVLAAGCLTGLLSFSRLLSWLFKKFHDQTVLVMAGFLLGSMNKIWPWKETVRTRINSKGEEVPFIQENNLPEDASMWQGMALIVAGAILLLLLDRLGRRNQAA